MITLYGITNCDTIKKTRAWLDRHAVEYVFHDYRKHGLDQALAQEFLAAIPLHDLINKRGTTWRQLPPDIQNNCNVDTALPLLMTHPALIRRPLLRSNTAWLTGYDETRLLQLVEHQQHQ
ncbi:MAG: Spx/MgsR family RNA polymerase-binding regulatory protein [Pseudomonadota bacterium]